MTICLLASTVPSYSFEGNGFFSCSSVFFSFDLLHSSISAILDLSDMVAEEVE